MSGPTDRVRKITMDFDHKAHSCLYKKQHPFYSEFHCTAVFAEAHWLDA